MDRRDFLLTTLAGACAAPRAAEAQPPAKVARIGVLVTGSIGSSEVSLAVDAFRQGLRERGYVEGQNFTIEHRGADGKIERLPGLATELARLL
jgi:putative ABC transport system substrate-binding protein